jgi:hypothetical protein
MPAYELLPFLFCLHFTIEVTWERRTPVHILDRGLLGSMERTLNALHENNVL